MLLRTALLLLVCVSAGSCATLGHYQTEAEEGGAAAAAAGGVEAAPPAAADPPAADSLLTNSLLEDQPQQNISDDAAAEEAGGEAAPQERPSEGGEAIRPVQQQQQQQQQQQPPNRLKPQQDSSWSLHSLRSSFQTLHGYFDSLVEFAGGHNGVCQYRCRYGDLPEPRPGFQLPEPDGCSSSLLGFQMDLGIPVMTECCSQLDACYDTCGSSKYDCDARFRSCLHGICSDLNRSLGFVSKVEACESVADTLFGAVWTLGCRPFMNSQRAACVCAGEEKDEL